MALPLSNEKLQEALDAYAKHGNQRQAAAALGLPRVTFQARLDSARVRLNVGGLTSKIDATLQGQVKRLEAELKRANQQSADAAAIKAIIGGLCERTATLEAPRWLNSKLSKASSPGVPTLFLSDFHWGEVVHPGQINGVNRYNLAIARDRLQYTVETGIHLCKILDRDMDYPGIVVPLGGDMISGNIHEELAATNELNTMPTVLDLYGQLIVAIERLADAFGHVFLPCVTGNHGRDTRKTWAKDRHHTSFDWLLYQFLAKHFERDRRITFFIPDGSDAAYRIYDYRYLLTHGDQFSGGDGMIGALGPIIRGDHRKRSRNMQIDMEYDTLLLGHWHQLMMLTRLIVNGSLKGYDEYAYTGNFPFELPTQGLWVTHPRHGITYRMPVYATSQPKPKSKDWVSIQR
jgi:hypothetical protein